MKHLVLSMLSNGLFLLSTGPIKSINKHVVKDKNIFAIKLNGCSLFINTTI